MIRKRRGRLKFGDSTHAAPFPSAVVVFRPTVADALSGFIPRSGYHQNL